MLGLGQQLEETLAVSIEDVANDGFQYVRTLCYVRRSCGQSTVFRPAGSDRNAGDPVSGQFAAEATRASFSNLPGCLPAAYRWERVQAVLNPYGIDPMPRGAPFAVAKEEDNPDTIAAKHAFHRRTLLLLFTWMRCH
jgi:hypothetical protein